MFAYTLQNSNLKVFQRILMTPNYEKLAMNRSVNTVRILRWPKWFIFLLRYEFSIPNSEFRIPNSEF